MIRLGVDVGGTNTDAVLIKGREVLATTKQATTDDIQSGIENAISEVVKQSGVAIDHINFCMIGTTQFTNAFVQRKALNDVAIIRLGSPAASALPPLTGWPQSLVQGFKQQIFMIEGGHNYDGKLNNPLNEQSLDNAIQQIKSLGYPAVAISSIFSPVNNEFELVVKQKLKEQIPQINVSLSHQIGRVGLIERENSTIMNASLACLAQKVVSAFERSLANLKISAPLYVTQNDGTLMSADKVRQYPVMTFASGPTNSMRGAAFLTGIKDAIVADIGGTTTDIGMLQEGFPRESSVHVDIGGVRTNFRMPDIIAIGLGGGSIVNLDGEETQVGPQSVGYQLLTQSQSFGGNQLTTTDIALMQGQVEIKGANHAKIDLTAAQLAAIESKIDCLLSDGLEQIKTSKQPVPLILVGGGHCIVAKKPAGISEMICVQHADVANAIGASIGQVAGEVDRVFDYQAQSREDCIESAKKMAIEQAIEAGGIAETITILDIQEIPLSYVSGQATRIKIKATGQLF